MVHFSPFAHYVKVLHICSVLISLSRLRRFFQKLWAGVFRMWAVVYGRKAVGLPHGVLFTLGLKSDELADL